MMPSRQKAAGTILLRWPDDVRGPEEWNLLRTEREVSEACVLFESDRTARQTKRPLRVVDVTRREDPVCDRERVLVDLLDGFAREVDRGLERESCVKQGAGLAVEIEDDAIGRHSVRTLIDDDVALGLDVLGFQVVGDAVAFDFDVLILDRSVAFEDHVLVLDHLNPIEAGLRGTPFPRALEVERELRLIIVDPIDFGVRPRLGKEGRGQDDRSEKDENGSCQESHSLMDRHCNRPAEN